MEEEVSARKFAAMESMTRRPMSYLSRATGSWKFRMCSWLSRSGVWSVRIFWRDGGEGWDFRMGFVERICERRVVGRACSVEM